MRILLLTDGIYPFVTGGMQKHSYYLAKFLTRMNVDVHLVHCSNDLNTIDVKEHPEFDDFNHEKITFKSYKFPSQGMFIGHYVRENKRYSEMIYTDLKDQLDDFNLIYCQGFTGWSFIQKSNRNKINAPILSNLHGYEMYQKAPSFKVKFAHYLLRGIAKKVSCNSDFVFSFGGQITDILKQIGVKKEQIIESPIGIESSWLTKNHHQKGDVIRKFVFVGRNERRKGIQELTSALKHLLQKANVPFEFHFIGDIPEHIRIKSKSIIYHGKIIQEEKIQAILQSSDVLVCPSYSEGMPTVIMEAMASGLAIIATDVGATSQQITDNGWLIANSNASTIEKAIEIAVNSTDSEILELKQNSLKKVQKRFLWEKVIEHKRTTFEDAIKKFKADKT
jgi:glycosyltransferase involved in cell wall biosynthesis